MDIPAFPNEVTGQDIVEISALIIQPIIMRDAFTGFPACRVKLIPDDEPPDLLFFHERKSSEKENCHCPETDGVFIRTNIGKIRADKRKMFQHPGEKPIRICPDSGCSRITFGEVSEGIECCKPVSPRFVYENRMNFAADFFEEAKA